MYLGYIATNKGRKGLLKSRMARTGPNDSTRVVWAIGDFSFSLFVLIFFTKVCLLYFRYLELSMDQCETTMRETGPNDAKRVVWAPGVFFLKLFCFFSLLNYLYRYLYVFYSREGLMGGLDEGNGPKRLKTRRLGIR